MTLKKDDGSWSATKITLFCTIAVMMFTGIMAAPTGFMYAGKVIAPWTTFPARIDAIGDKQEIMFQMLTNFVADQKIHDAKIERSLSSAHRISVVLPEDSYVTNKAMKTEDN